MTKTIEELREFKYETYCDSKGDSYNENTREDVMMEIMF